jgi:hypothetical protein
MADTLAIEETKAPFAVTIEKDIVTPFNVQAMTDRGIDYAK